MTPPSIDGSIAGNNWWLDICLSIYTQPSLPIRRIAPDVASLNLGDSKQEAIIKN